MKKPNDKKRPNSNSGSLGKFLRSRAVMVWESVKIVQHTDPETKVVHNLVVPSQGTRYSNPLARGAFRVA